MTKAKAAPPLPEKRQAPGKKAKKTPGKAASLPPVCVLDIVARDADGQLLARAVSSQSDSQEQEAGAASLIALPVSGKMPAAGIGSRVLAKIFPAKGEDKKTALYQGRIIRILSKQPAEFLAIIRQSRDGRFRLEPISRKQRELWLETRALGAAQSGDLVLAAPLCGRRGAAAHFGSVKKIIGAAAGEKALSAIALYSHNIPAEFPPAALAEARQAALLPLSSGGKREDWRQIPFVTIDPETAKDHDDAVFARADCDSKNKGGHTLFVAIADVAAYVRPNSALDSEARKRGNSVYFPDRVVPMLPEEISNNLCSLREGEYRPALAAKITLNAKGRIIRHRFHRILMRSHAKLSYEQAQAAIDSGQEPIAGQNLLQTVLKPLWAAYCCLNHARNARQPLELSLPERKIIVNAQGRVTDIRAIARLDAHRLIEEFMIAANIAAAETLKTKNKPLLFRIHDSPPPQKREALKTFLRTIGIKLSAGADMTPEKLNFILAKAKGKDHEELLNQVILRAQAQAEYSAANIGHFGLKLRDYAHFTSPIRRYADLLAHRALIAALNLGKDGLTKREEAQLGGIAAEITAAERRAQAAERETNDRLIADYLSSHIGARFSGRINGVTRAGLFITLENTGADGLAPITSLKDKNGQKDYYYFDEARFALIGEHSRKGFQLGDKVEVRLLDVQKSAGSLRFALMSPPKNLPFSGRLAHKSPTGRSRKPAYAAARKP